MRIFIAAIILSFVAVPARGQENMHDLREAYENTFYPIYLLNERCGFLSQTEADGFTRATRGLSMVLGDFETLQVAMGADPETFGPSEENIREAADRTCDSSARKLVEEAYFRLISINTSVVPLYIKRQEEYLGTAYGGLARAYALSIRCPALDKAGHEALQARFFRAKAGMEALIGEDKYNQAVDIAAEAVSRENFGPCGEKTRDYQQSALKNTNYLLSRIDFLLNIRTPGARQP